MMLIVEKIMAERDRSPIVSVLMTVYNGEKYLKDAVKSILSQSFTDFEFVIVDDGSSDRSLEVLQEFNDPRIRLVLRDHQGLVPALNAGLATCVGKYVARMDADDVADPSRLNTQCAYLDNHNDTDFVCSDIYTIDAGGRVSGEQCDRYDNDKLRDGLLFRKKIKPVIHPTIMARRDVLVRLGGYREFVSSEDHDLWLRAVDSHGFFRIPQKLLFYRIHGGGVSRAKGSLQSTSSAMTAVSYLVKKRSGKDLFFEYPEVFEDLRQEVMADLDANVMIPAYAFREARLKMITGRRLSGFVGILRALLKYGPAALPFSTIKKTNSVVERAALRALSRIG